MAERTAEVMAIKDPQQRWDAWMFLAQARVVPRFTEKMFEVFRVPDAVYARMHKRLHETLHTAGPELPEDPGKAWRGDVEFIQLVRASKPPSVQPQHPPVAWCWRRSHTSSNIA